MNWCTTDAADEDLISARKWIAADNPDAARAFLAESRRCFDRLSEFPEFGPLAKIKGDEFSGIRFTVLLPPFNRWLVFYRVTEAVEIIRVLYGSQNWRAEPERYF